MPCVDELDSAPSDVYSVDLNLEEKEIAMSAVWCFVGPEFNKKSLLPSSAERIPPLHH
jgi:hypothetical protein